MKWIRNNTEIIFITGVGLFVFLFLSLALLAAIYEVQTRVVSGTVIEKNYTPDSRSNGTGVGAKGEVVVVTTGEKEKYTLILDGVGKDGKPRVGSLEVKPDEYARCKIGDSYPECGSGGR